MPRDDAARRTVATPMSLFKALPQSPPDALLKILSAFANDKSPEKVDLGVGVYKDEHGEAPVLRCVKQAEHWLVETQETKTYLSSSGSPAFNAAMQELLWGALKRPELARVRTLQTAGGSAALRTAAELVLRARPGAAMWIPDPTWANHAQIFRAAGAELRTYPYYEAKSQSLTFDAMLGALERVSAGDCVVLHGRCHNPSGFDLSPPQWETLSDFLLGRGALPLVDVAYQGFGTGVEEDAAGWRLMAERMPEMLVATSCSKNFGLYRDRTGALSLIAANAEEAEKTANNLMAIIRALYSTPPDHGAALVAWILREPDLKAVWLEELGAMRERLQSLRRNFSRKLAERGLAGAPAIERGAGMFCLLDMTHEAVQRLESHFHIYATGAGRINLAGLSDANLDYVADAFLEVTPRR